MTNDVAQPEPALAKQRGFKFTDKNLPIFLIGPVILIFAVITLYPLIYSLYISTLNMVLTRPDLGRDFIGLGNYIKIFTDDIVHRAALNTLIFIVVGLFLQLTIGMVLALLLDREFKGKGIVISLLILPLTVAPIVVGLLWRYMYNGEYGIIAYILKSLGFENYVVLASPFWALPGVILADVWHWTPFIMLLFLTGLRALPPAPFEAAKVDGASWWQTFRHITLPMLKPIIMLAMLLRTMEMFKFFDEVYIMTMGGPGSATETLAYQVYRKTFMFFTMGRGAALAILMLIVIIFISKMYINLFKEKQRMPVPVDAEAQ